MGARFSYILVIQKHRQAELLSSVTSHERLAPPFNECYTITFEVDKALFSYLKESITRDLTFMKRLFFRKKDYPDYFPTESTAKIGCVYLEFVSIPNTDLLLAIFGAGTTRMSLLFFESTSIKEWFAQLAQSLNARSCFLDLEDGGYKIVLGEELDAAGFKATYDLEREQDHE